MADEPAAAVAAAAVESLPASTSVIAEPPALGEAETAIAAASVVTVPPADAPVADGEEDDGDEELAYQKTLRSDVTADLSFQLLQQIASEDGAYADFHTSDLRALSRVLSVLSVAHGEKIIERGEEASYCAIVLDGCFQAVVSPVLSVDLRRGALVGEMALYLGGHRSADIVCSEDGVLAVITFAELRQLGQTHPNLQRALYFLFAQASIKKLRKMTESPSPAAAGAMSSEVKPLTPAAPPATTGAPPAKKELLYRSRIEKERQESVARAEKQQERLVKAEKNSKNDKLRYENAQRRIEKYGQIIDQRDAQIATLTHEATRREARMAQLERAREELTASLAKLQALSATEASTRAQNEAKLTRAAETAMSEAEAKYEPQLAHARAELTRALAELETNVQHVRRSTEDHARMSDAHRDMQSAVGELTGVRNALFSELHATKQKKEALELALHERERQLAEARSALKLAEPKIAEAEDTRAALASWKAKALEAAAAIENASKASARLVAEASRGKQEVEDDLRRYQQLLRWTTVGRFVAESRLRKALAATHERVSDLLLTAMEENLASGGGSAQGASSDAPDLSSRNASRAAFKTIARRKKAYLSTLLTARAKPREVVSSLNDEVSKLRAPIEEIIERVRHWRMTSESFFARSIELRGEKEAASAALRATLPQIEHIKRVMRANQTEAEGAAARHAETARINHHLKSELEQMRNKYGLSSGGTSVGAASTSDDKASKKSRKTEQLRQQQEQLQANIVKLQLHYNQLLSAVQGLAPPAGAFSSSQQLAGIDEKQQLQQPHHGYSASSTFPQYQTAPPLSQSVGRSSSQANLQQAQISHLHSTYALALAPPPNAAASRTNIRPPHLYSPQPPSTQAQQQRALQDQRQLYEQAIGKQQLQPQVPSQPPPAQDRQQWGDDALFRRIENALFLPSLPPVQPLHSHSPSPSLAQTQRGPAAASPLLTLKSHGAQTSRIR